MKPTYDDFDKLVIGLSGGKDSTDLALWARFESGIPLDKLVFVSADTANEDPFTYAYLALLQEILGQPILMLKPERGFYDLAFHKKRFPARRAQFCTQYLKIIPIREFVMDLIRQGHRVARLSGVRHDEGRPDNDRASVPEWAFHDGDLLWVHYPIRLHSLKDVYAMLKKYIDLDRVIGLIECDENLSLENREILIHRIRERGIPYNPIYAMGARRVGCFPCVNSRKSEIRAIAQFRPERIEFIDKAEMRMREHYDVVSFFHKKTVPERFRSLPVERNGEHYNIPTIHDVVEWSKTSRGASHYAMFEDDDFLTVCDIGGTCE